MMTTHTRTKADPRSLLATGAGNALEWFDWQIYATFAPFIAAAMFDPKEPLSAFLSTLAIFAVGFVARPVGGILFGWIADRRGRKTSLILAIALASAGSLFIGLLPTFAAAGSVASLLLLLSRLIQGLAHGGEMPAAQTFLSETAPPSARGLWSSFVYVSGTSGILLATVVGATLTTVLDPALMSAWGWRIPFLAAAALGVVTLFMRARMTETESFETATLAVPAAQRNGSLWSPLRKSWRTLVVIVGLTAGSTVSFYVWGVTAPAYASAVLGMDRSASLWSGCFALVLFIAALPFWGRVSDRIGRKPVFLIGLIGTAVASFPMTWLLGSEPWTLIVAMGVCLFFLAAVTSIAPAIYSEMLPTRIRTIGTALPYAVAVAIFGGTAPYLQAWLSTAGQSALFTAYCVLLLLVSAAVTLGIRETRGISL